MAQIIAHTLGRELKYEMVDFHSSRPGHDLRYGLDGSKMHELGWVQPIGFDEAIRRTIMWTVEHRKWLEEL